MTKAIKEGGVWDGSSSPSVDPLCICPRHNLLITSAEAELALQLTLFAALAYFVAFFVFLVVKTVLAAESKKKDIVRRASEHDSVVPYLHPSLGGPDFYLPRRESAFVFNHPGGSLGDSGVSGVGGRSSRDTMVSAKQGGSVGSNVANLSGGNSGGRRPNLALAPLTASNADDMYDSILPQYVQPSPSPVASPVTSPASPSLGSPSILIEHVNEVGASAGMATATIGSRSSHQMTYLDVGDYVTYPGHSPFGSYAAGLSNAGAVVGAPRQSGGVDDYGASAEKLLRILFEDPKVRESNERQRRRRSGDSAGAGAGGLSPEEVDSPVPESAATAPVGDGLQHGFGWRRKGPLSKVHKISHFYNARQDSRDASVVGGRSSSSPVPDIVFQSLHSAHQPDVGGRRGGMNSEPDIGRPGAFVSAAATKGSVVSGSSSPSPLPRKASEPHFFLSSTAGRLHGMRAIGGWGGGGVGGRVNRARQGLAPNTFIPRSNSGGDVASAAAAAAAASSASGDNDDSSVRDILDQQRKESAASFAAPIGPEEAEMIRARQRRRVAVSFHSHESNGGGGGGGGGGSEETEI